MGQDSGLTGTIPTEVGRMVQLSKLDIAVAQHMHGSIPTEIGLLSTNLQILKLSWCGLTGTLPTALAQLTHLVSLELDNNPLHGTIPTEYGSMTQLRTYVYIYIERERECV